MIGSVKQPKVSIIILNWNGLEDTIECLESLQKITYPNYELIVIDNNSEGSDAEVLRGKFGGYIHLIENDKNYGFCEGNNIGMRHALKNQADYILLLNNDTTVATDFLSELVRVGESDSEIGLLGPKIYFYHEPNKIWFAGGRISLLAASSNRGYRQLDEGQFDQVSRVDFVSGSCMLIKRSVLECIGLLDASYFFSFEDADFSLRAIQAKFVNVYVPSARIWHKVFSSGRRNPDITYYTSRNAMIFARKHFRAFRKASLRAVIGVITELVFYTVRNRDARILRTMVKGLRDGLTIDLKSSKAGRVT